jgi:hypothetical protein
MKRVTSTCAVEQRSSSGSCIFASFDRVSDFDFDFNSSMAAAAAEAAPAVLLLLPLLRSGSGLNARGE